MSAVFPQPRDSDIGVCNPDCVSDYEIKKILGLAEIISPVQGKIQRDDQFVSDTGHRDVETYPIPQNQKWLDLLILDLAKKANETFQFQITGLLERPQLLKYSEGSIGYGWHPDIGTGYASLRKISLSIVLNEGFSGGELAFFIGGEALLNPERGQAIAFPSFMAHKVNPVTKGTRWSLVAWVAGEPFR